MRFIKYLSILVLTLTLVLSAPAPTAAQCPMCKSNVESTIKGPGKKTGLGLNDGIMVLFAMPYIAVAFIGLLWYKNSRQRKNAPHTYKV